ncbi:hypothetical protein XI07_13170 [Bradyrhizobium sp. CCBAU 11445]|nr:hypothetical protein [Bradyrhizobium sp. CCBAU 11445]
MSSASAAEPAAGHDRGRTILDDYSIRLQLEHLWNTDRCPALSREQRVARIRELSPDLAR